MIPRYQSVLFALLVLASLVMGVVLWQLRERAHQRLVDGPDSTPTQAPQIAPAEQAVLLVANDSDGSLLTQNHSLPLPVDPGARARAVLGKLLDIYAAHGSTHPVPGGAASILQVFLLPVPVPGRPATAPLKPGFSASVTAVPAGGAANGAAGSPTANDPSTQSAMEPESNTPQIAVINLAGGFVAGHPSGLETETLTVLSLCGTLHANLPRVAQVRFLVDGQPRNTLAGHADLTRTYITADAAASAATNP
jgi:hypothetical protein